MRAVVTGIEHFLNMQPAHVLCDECGDLYLCLHHHKWTARDQVQVDLQEAGWQVNGDHHVCPECRCES